MTEQINYTNWPLLLEDYQKVSEKTASIKEVRFNQTESRVAHGIIGASTEANEMLDNLKKGVWYGKGIDYGNIKEEIGDILWYIAEICNAKGWSMMDLARQNYEKLQKKRFKSGQFTEDEAINRNIESEQELFIESNSEVTSEEDFNRQLANTVGDVKVEDQVNKIRQAVSTRQEKPEPFPNRYTGKK